MEAAVEESLLFDLLFSNKNVSLPPELGTPDWNEIKKTRSRIERDLEFGAGAGRGLSDLFPQSLEQFRARFPGQNPIRLFLDSQPFMDYREIPYAEKGISLEEAFYEFLSKKDPDREPLYRTEFFQALFKELTVQRRPAFLMRHPAIRRTPRGWCAVSQIEDGLHLFAALDQGFVHGAITPLIATLLHDPQARRQSREHALVAQRLRTMGLL